MELILNTWRPRVLSILRIVAAFLFMLHGTQKIFGFPAPHAYSDEAGQRFHAKLDTYSRASWTVGA